MRSSELPWILALIGTIAYVGCGGGGERICSIASVADAPGCIEYGNTDTTTAAMEKCARRGGVYSNTACPSEKRVGRCVFTGTFVSGTEHYYAPNTVEAVMQACRWQSMRGVDVMFLAN